MVNTETGLWKIEIDPETHEPTVVPLNPYPSAVASEPPWLSQVPFEDSGVDPGHNRARRAKLPTS